MKKWMDKNVVASALSLVLLGGIAVDMSTISAPADVGPYHEKVKEISGQIPKRLGDWVGEEKRWEV